MGLPWIRLDTTIFDHPKFADLIVDKKWRLIVAHLQGMTYSGKHGLGGHVPSSAVKLMHIAKSDADALVACELWETDPVDGYRIHGWEERQPSAETWERRREAARQNAQKRWAK